MSDKTESPSQPQVGEDLPKETIIIVGCVCGGVVVILTIILIVLCCKRNQAKQHYEKQQETRQMTPVPPPVTLSAPPPATKAPPSGMDNPGLDQTDGHMAPPPRVFTTDTSGNQYRPASPYNYDHAPNGYPNGHPNGHLGGHHGNKPAGLAPPPSYDNLRNEALNQHNQHHLRNEALNQHNQLNHNRAASPLHNKMLYLDDPYDHKEPSSRSESGVSTPDPQKPKKVIYEVVV